MVNIFHCIIFLACIFVRFSFVNWKINTTAISPFLCKTNPHKNKLNIAEPECLEKL